MSLLPKLQGMFFLKLNLVLWQLYLGEYNRCFSLLYTVLLVRCGWILKFSWLTFFSWTLGRSSCIFLKQSRAWRFSFLSALTRPLLSTSDHCGHLLEDMEAYTFSFFQYAKPMIYLLTKWVIVFLWKSLLRHISDSSGATLRHSHSVINHTHIWLNISVII